MFLFRFPSQATQLAADWAQAAGMVVHPSPGHYSGTLVNALLHHCSLPAMHLPLGAQAPLSLLGGECCVIPF